ncbi:hypothetical protein C9374_006615 [Naegleria lovaniensis]|uniref:Methyltransferase domain-containing protein n=1 Tax=Naegleria lovaniensis TaxID=51637 RepID=A0AA88KJ19_NAELO|nr:uncharacterized protein C9374_006615 [Naegleria lovaniensis]KAG2379498.1 hypothetical protein C9374_006615 [Naegleria lovaniensis]
MSTSSLSSQSKPPNYNLKIPIPPRSDRGMEDVHQIDSHPSLNHIISLIDEKDPSVHEDESEQDLVHSLGLTDPSEEEKKQIRKKYNLPPFNTLFPYRRGRDYWNYRYEERGSELFYDWYLSFSQMKSTLQPYLKSYDMRILIPGCGNSRLPRQLVKSGFKNILCIDYSDVIVKRMRKIHEKYNEFVKFHCVDACSMKMIDSDSYDLVIDKALTDSMTCSTSEIRSSITDNVTRYYFQVSRILKPGGKLLVYSSRDRSDLVKMSDASLWSSICITKVARVQTTNEKLRKFFPSNLANSSFHLLVLSKKGGEDEATTSSTNNDSPLDGMFQLSGGLITQEQASSESSSIAIDAMRRNQSKSNSILPKLADFERRVEEQEEQTHVIHDLL